MVKKVGTVCLISEKECPPLPNTMLLRIMLSGATPGHPTLIDGGGWEMTNGGLSAAFKTILSPSVLSLLSTGMTAMSCVECSNYFFHDCSFVYFLEVLDKYSLVVIIIYLFSDSFLLSNDI